MPDRHPYLLLVSERIEDLLPILPEVRCPETDRVEDGVHCQEEERQCVCAGVHEAIRIERLARTHELVVGTFDPHAENDGFTLVAENEADLKLGKISVDSPIGKGLLGKKKGDTVDIKVPSGIMKFEIVGISR